MSATDGFGTKWAFSTDGTTFNTVADVTTVGILAVKVDTIDTSSHDSDEQWSEFIGGMKDAGELTMDVNYDPAVHGTIVDAAGGMPLHHRITLTDTASHVVTFDAIITGIKATAPYNDKLTAAITLKVSGKPTITAGA